jgi:uncharacterized protein with PIN domain
MPSYCFYGEVNDLLPRDLRNRWFERACAENASVKHAIETLGVPHTEVGRVERNGRPASLACPLDECDRVEVYATASPPASNGPAPRFLADAHLGGLARRLRLLGFDTALASDASDAQLAALAGDEGRIVLSRDRELLKHRAVARGRFVRAVRTDEQLREVVSHFGLRTSMCPFSRCLACNGALRAASADEVRERLPPAVAARQTRFTQCTACRRVYWPGSHWERMRALIESIRAGCA